MNNIQIAKKFLERQTFADTEDAKYAAGEVLVETAKNGFYDEDTQKQINLRKITGQLIAGTVIVMLLIAIGSMLVGNISTPDKSDYPNTTTGTISKVKTIKYKKSNKTRIVCSLDYYYTVDGNVINATTKPKKDFCKFDKGSNITVHYNDENNSKVDKEFVPYDGNIKLGIFFILSPLAFLVWFYILDRKQSLLGEEWKIEADKQAHYAGKTISAENVAKLKDELYEDIRLNWRKTRISKKRK